jgi:hypothetical protein
MLPSDPDTAQTPFWVALVRDDIQTLKTEIVQRLDRINGSVRRHDTEIALLKNQTHPPESCQIVGNLAERVEQIERAREVAETAAARIWRIAAAVGALILAITAGLIEAFVR